MSNTIRLNDDAPAARWLTMSNQGTDRLLDLLITAAKSLEKTHAQQSLVDFIARQRDVNSAAPGTASFDIEEMPWEIATMAEDAVFLAEVAKSAKSEAVWEKLGYEPNWEIVIPWLDMLESLMREAGGLADSTGSPQDAGCEQ